MIPLFVNLTILVSLIAAVGVGVFSYQRSADTVSLAQRNAARMEQVAYAIRSGLRPALMNGAVLSPLGDPLGPPVAVATQPDGKTAVNPSEQVCLDGMAAYQAGNPSQQFNQTCRRMGVPGWLVSDDRTPWGGSYAYCPYAIAPYGDPPAAPATTTGLVRDNATSSYKVRTVQLRGRTYVLQSDKGTLPASSPATDTENEQVVGFLLSPPPRVTTQVPRCQDVAKVNGAWLVIPTTGGAADGSYPGSVVPILSRGVGVGQVANQGEVVIYAAASASGLGTGDDPADAMALKDALDAWHLTPWRATTLRVAGGSYDFTAADIVPGAGAIPRLALTTTLPGRGLRIESSDGNPVTLTGSAGPVDLAIGVDASLDSVSLGAGIQLRPLDGSNVSVTNAGLSLVRVDGGSLSLGRGTSVAANTAVNPYAAIDLISGQLKLSGGQLSITGKPQSGIRVFGGDLTFNGTSLVVDLPPGGSTVSGASNARVRVAPDANGNWPSVGISGGASRVLPVEASASATYAPQANAQPALNGCDSTGACVAACPTPGGARDVYVAAQGSCVAADPYGTQGSGSPSDPRPQLMASGNLLGLNGHTDGWMCAWRPGDVFVSSTIAGGEVRNGTAALPYLSATARCMPNPTLVAPQQQAAQ